MAGYLEQIPPRTQLGEVFNDLHEQVRGMAEMLDGIRTGDPGYTESWRQEDMSLIPGFELSCRRRIHAGSGDRAVEHRRISAVVDGQYHPLLKVSDIEDRDIPSVYKPRSVEGYRGDEKLENLSGSFSLSQIRYEDGVIDVHLKVPDPADEDDYSHELSGGFHDSETIRMDALSEINHDRLDKVTTGILGRLAAVRLILDGGSARDALTVLVGHDVQYVAPDESESSAVQDPFTHGETFSRSA